MTLFGVDFTQIEINYHQGYAQKTTPLPKSNLIRQPSQNQYNQRVQKLVGTGIPKKEVLSILDQLVQALISDLQEHSVYQTSPLALKGIQVRAPLSPQVADWLDMRFSTLIGQKSQLTLKVCTPCQAQRTAIANGSWVIQHGYPIGPKLVSLGQELGIKRFIDFDVSWNAKANTVILRTRLFDVSQAQVVWEEDYRSSPISTETQRQGGDNPKIGQGIYDQQKKLELNSSDHQFMVSFGYGFVPTLLGNQSIYDLAFGYGETFGNHSRFRYQLILEPFFNITPGLIGFSIGGEVHWRLSQLVFLPLESGGKIKDPLSDPKKTNIKKLSKKQLKNYTDPLNGFWVHSGLYTMYIDFNQGLSMQLGMEYITSIQLGVGFDLFYTLFDQEASMGTDGVGGRFKLAVHF